VAAGFVTTVQIEILALPGVFPGFPGNPVEKLLVYDAQR
jgi:hypothetical protein